MVLNYYLLLSIYLTFPFHFLQYIKFVLFLFSFMFFFQPLFSNCSWSKLFWYRPGLYVYWEWCFRWEKQTEYFKQIFNFCLWYKILSYLYLLTLIVSYSYLYDIGRILLLQLLVLFIYLSCYNIYYYINKLFYMLHYGTKI